MNKSVTFDLPISGMTCASCAGRVERALRKVSEAEDVSVNFATERVRLQAPSGPARVAPSRGHRWVRRSQ